VTLITWRRYGILVASDDPVSIRRQCGHSTVATAIVRLLYDSGDSMTDCNFL